MVSFRMVRGRSTPCSLPYSPHALQTGEPDRFLRHSDVFWVLQLAHVVCGPSRAPRLTVRRFDSLGLPDDPVEEVESWSSIK
jgi:hypothetical protein